MVNAFLQYLQYEKNYSPHTALSYHTDLTQFCDFIQVTCDQFNPSEIQSEQIQSWILFLTSHGVSARSISRKISTLKSFWHFLLKQGLVLGNPMLKVVLPKTNKSLPAFFKNNEMEMALDTTFQPDDFEAVRDHLILKFFYLCGVRLSELINIRDNDIDVSNKLVRVIGKRNKQRVIPLGDELCAEIEYYQTKRNAEVDVINDNLFLRTNGLKLYPKKVYLVVHQTMSQFSSLHKRSPHVLRHSFATAMLNGGADINALKELLGHSSLAATQVYTHTSFEELYNIYEHAHPRAYKKGGKNETKNPIHQF